MKTKKLSEVSVNAATLDSQQPGFYDQGIHGLGVHIGAPKNPAVTNLNDSSMKTGFYWTTSTATGKPPTESGVAGFLIHISARTTLQNQIYFGFLSAKMYVRAQENNVWTAWKSVTLL